MGQQASKDLEVSGSGVVSSTVNTVKGAHGVAKNAAGTVTEVVGAVGAEDREAIRLEKDENWGRVEEGDTLWTLSEKHLGDATRWPQLHSACRKELGSDPLLLLPGSRVTEACIAHAKGGRS